MAENTQKNKKSASMVITSLVVILLFFCLTLFLVLQRQTIPTYDEARKEQRLKNLADLTAANEKILTQYHWVDRTKGVVGIPIDRAMDLVLTELQSNRPHAAGPINLPATPPGNGQQPGQVQPQQTQQAPQPAASKSQP